MAHRRATVSADSIRQAIRETAAEIRQVCPKILSFLINAHEISISYYVKPDEDEEQVQYVHLTPQYRTAIRAIRKVITRLP